MILVGPTGRITQGHVLDVSRVAFQRALRDYDSLLYVEWNPKKLRGWGCWEIRRQPENYVTLESIAFDGNTYTLIGLKEIDLVNHVLDCAFLNYDQVRKVKSIDRWATDGYKGKDLTRNMEAREKAAQAKMKEDKKEDLKYASKQLKSVGKDFKEMVASGINPALIANHWDK